MENSEGIFHIVLCHHRWKVLHRIIGAVWKFFHISTLLGLRLKVKGEKLENHRFSDKNENDMENDTSFKCLERMVIAVLINDEVELWDEVQHFWRKKWRLRGIEDPEDKDPLSYALKACIVERMADLWNSPPKNRREKIPAWCEDVPPYEPGFSVVEESYRKYFEDYPSPVFEKRNIFAPGEFMFFV